MSRSFVKNTTVAILFVAFAYLVWEISRVEGWININYLFLGVMLIGVKKDQKPIEWIKFLPKGVLLLAVLYYLYRNAPAIWYKLAGWQLHNSKHFFQWNDLFKSIPYNDGHLFRLYQPVLFTKFMRWVYGFGFSLALWICVIRSLLARDAKKMLRYVFSSHFFQLPIIVPFYTLVFVQEVWYVLGQPDGMARHFKPGEVTLWVQNCFPSMHTSVSFALLLLALREKDQIFKWVMATYCALVIFSTLYLEIHWVIDVFGGLLLGYGAVKFVDYLFNRIGSKKEGLPQPDTSTVPQRLADNA
jgi:membrane-associated phospholipid phosphatase